MESKFPSAYSIHILWLWKTAGGIISYRRRRLGNLKEKKKKQQASLINILETHQRRKWDHPRLRAVLAPTGSNKASATESLTEQTGSDREAALYPDPWGLFFFFFFLNFYWVFHSTSICLYMSLQSPGGAGVNHLLIWCQDTWRNCKWEPLTRL